MGNLGCIYIAQYWFQTNVLASNFIKPSDPMDQNKSRYQAWIDSLLRFHCGSETHAILPSSDRSPSHSTRNRLPPNQADIHTHWGKCLKGEV